MTGTDTSPGYSAHSPLGTHWENSDHQGVQQTAHSTSWGVSSGLEPADVPHILAGAARQVDPAHRQTLGRSVLSTLGLTPRKDEGYIAKDASGVYRVVCADGRVFSPKNDRVGGPDRAGVYSLVQDTYPIGESRTYIVLDPDTSMREGFLWVDEPGCAALVGTDAGLSDNPKGCIYLDRSLLPFVRQLPEHRGDGYFPVIEPYVEDEQGFMTRGRWIYVRRGHSRWLHTKIETLKFLYDRGLEDLVDPDAWWLNAEFASNRSGQQVISPISHTKAEGREKTALLFERSSISKGERVARHHPAAVRTIAASRGEDSEVIGQIFLLKSSQPIRTPAGVRLALMPEQEKPITAD